MNWEIFVLRWCRFDDARTTNLQRSPVRKLKKLQTEDLELWMFILHIYIYTCSYMYIQCIYYIHVYYLCKYYIIHISYMHTYTHVYLCIYVNVYSSICRHIE